MFKKIFRKLRKVAGDAAPIIGALTGNPLLGAGIGAFASDDPVKSALLGGLGGFGGKVFGMGAGNAGGAGLGSLSNIFNSAGTMAKKLFNWSTNNNITWFSKSIWTIRFNEFT